MTSTRTRNRRLVMICLMGHMHMYLREVRYDPSIEQRTNERTNEQHPSFSTPFFVFILFSRWMRETNTKEAFTDSDSDSDSLSLSLYLTSRFDYHQQPNSNDPSSSSSSSASQGPSHYLGIITGVSTSQAVDRVV